MTAPLTALNSRLGKVARRICTEFHEMPGLRLTQPQVRRLWSLSDRDCEEALEYLCGSCQLAHDSTGCYLLSSQELGTATRHAPGGVRR